LSNLANEAHETRLYRDAIKDGKEKYFEDINNIQNLIANRMQMFVNEYTQKYEFPILFDEGYTILRYRGGQEYKGHSDYAPHIPRYLSALILLNPSDYEGGGTYFEHFDVNIKPDKPSLVLFPSNYAYTHRAMPVIKGSKYAIVTWLGHPMDWDGMPPMYTGK
jgi:predicted 2-oxoglutarate/Fe(II)-dependent dioxygenase YbiX